MKFKETITRLLANNPISGLYFLISGKRLSFNHLTIKTIAFLLNQRIPFHNLTIDVSDPIIKPTTKAWLYWGIYEQEEIALVKKYLKSTDDVIELGASIGVMASIVYQIQKHGRYIAVEANPTLINALKKNLILNRQGNFTIINKAIDYKNTTISFGTTDNTLAGKISQQETSPNTVSVETTTLSLLCEEYRLDEFALICDIEGAEITLFLHDTAALKKCRVMIVELHDTTHENKAYKVQDILDVALNADFEIIDQIKDVFVFKKNK